jgi:hypothetical protein
MGVLITCDNKGCFQSVEPLLNVSTNEVICTNCGKPINSVTHFMKIQLKTLGQTMKKQETNKAYSVFCSKCGNNSQPFVARDGTICCSNRNCGAPITNLSAPMAHMIRTMLGSGGGGSDIGGGGSFRRQG